MHINIEAALNECGPGHPAHVTTSIKIGDRIGRIVAIRTGNKPGTFNLTFSDRKVDLRFQPGGDTLYDVKSDLAHRTIRNFLIGSRVADENDIFDQMINQGVRECYVIKLTPTRCRIEYEMPNAGDMQAWRYQTTVGGMTYVSDW